MSSVVAARWNRVQGDIGDSIVAKMNGVSDLTSVVTVHGYVSNDRHAATELSGAVVDATARTVRIYLGTAGQWLPTVDLGDLDEDEFKLEIELIFVDGTELTWPEKGKAVINVTKQTG